MKWAARAANSATATRPHVQASRINGRAPTRRTQAPSIVLVAWNANDACNSSHVQYAYALCLCLSRVAEPPARSLRTQAVEARGPVITLGLYACIFEQIGIKHLAPEVALVERLIEHTLVDKLQLGECEGCREQAAGSL